VNLNLLELTENMVNPTLEGNWISSSDNAVDAAFQIALASF
jgi:hypothetical protein